MRPYTVLMQEPARGSEEWHDWRQQMDTLDEWLKGPQVDITYQLNDDTDYAVRYETAQGIKVARISETITINGVRWQLQPGKNTIPRAVYEFLMECPDQRNRLSCPQPGQFGNVMGAGRLFQSSFS